MKLVFIHSSARVYYDDAGNRYTNGSYSKEVWDVYLSVFSEIKIVMRKDDNFYPKEIIEKEMNIIPSNIQFVPLQDVNSSIHEFLNPFNRRKRRKMVEEAMADGDVVIVRLPGLNYALSCAKRLGKKNLIEVVGCPFDSLWNHSWKGKILAIPSFFSMRHIVRNSDNVIYVTKYFLQKRYPTQGRSINCSNVRLDYVGSSEERVFLPYNDSEPFKIGTACGLGVKYKGQQYVIKAIGKLKQAGFTNIEYHLAGEGDARYLKAIAKKYDVVKNIKFLGAIPHAEIFSWYKTLDLYIQPSLSEGLPRSLIEAMGCGTPCAGSNAGGIPELLDSSVIFRKRDVNAILEIIKRMMDPQVALQQSRMNLSKSMEYSADVLAQRRIRFMRELFYK